MVTLIALTDKLQGWPAQKEVEDAEEEENQHTTVEIHCAGPTFEKYQLWVERGDDVETTTWSEFDTAITNQSNEDTSSLNDDENNEKEDSQLPEKVDLFSLTEEELAEIDYYQVLQLPYRPHLTPDDVKKAYRKASLQYHPDKSGRGEEDAVFLKVKAAFETLGGPQRKAYDSTEMPFDDSIPEDPSSSNGKTSAGDFFEEFGPVFRRNLHFDARLLSEKNNNNNNNKSNSKNRRKSKQSSFKQGPPSLGDPSTPIEQVHEFYDYWTHFTSWRDFSLKAARELETQDHLENAESRYEKRWFQNQIDRQAKKLKQQEQARITTLVERAMACDPRLIDERKRLIQEKEMKQKQREQEALEKKQKEEEARLEEERKAQEEKERKAQEKLQREKEKKMLRKAKQAFRKLVAEALEALLEPEHALEDPVDMICGKLDREQLLKFNARLESFLPSDPAQVVQAVRKRADNLDEEEEQDEENEASHKQSNGLAIPSKEDSTSSNNKNQNSNGINISNKKIPFTMEELSSLAKGVKKYPPGGANRWDQIASYINQVCRPETPRSKEECIEIYNQNKTAKNTSTSSTTNGSAATAAAKHTESNSDEDVWTEEQDQQLQDGLAKYPASMDKNERWVNIAKAVPGKTKKQCVNRFKAIRDAIKNKK